MAPASQQEKAAAHSHNSPTAVPSGSGPLVTVWRSQEEVYLDHLSKLCLQAAKHYNDLYCVSKGRQRRLRLPAIMLSSITGVASLSSTNVPMMYQHYVAIGVGVINVVTAMIATYESYIGIGHTVTASLQASVGLKRLADELDCETFLPVEDRPTDGIQFLRDAFARYQALMEQAPPLPKPATEELISRSHVIRTHIRRCSQELRAIQPLYTDRSRPPSARSSDGMPLAALPYTKHIHVQVSQPQPQLLKRPPQLPLQTEQPQGDDDGDAAGFEDAREHEHE